jgi:hypothetical protein
MNCELDFSVDSELERSVEDFTLSLCSTFFVKYLCEALFIYTFLSAFRKT